MVAKAERTRQQLDPVGTFSNRLMTLGAIVASFLYAVVVVLSSLDRNWNPALGLLSLVVLGIGCVLLVVATDPYRGPVTRQMHSIVVVCALLAATLSALSSWGDPGFLRYAWGSTSLGLLFVALAPFRPAREIVGTGALAAVFIGFITMLQASSHDSKIPVLAVIGIAVMPLLALNFASAAYSLSTIHSLDRWQRLARQAVERMSPEREAGIARSVQQNRVTVLNREVVPFFAELLQRDTVTEEDRERARAIADSIRGVMVSEVDRTWLENLLVHLGRRAGRLGAMAPLVHDDDGSANLMNYDQRTGLRALIMELYERAIDHPHDLVIDLSREGARCYGVVSVRIDMVDGLVKSRFGPYITVLKMVFQDLRVEHLHSVLTLRFSYEQR